MIYLIYYQFKDKAFMVSLTVNISPIGDRKASQTYWKTCFYCICGQTQLRYAPTHTIFFGLNALLFSYPTYVQI